MLSVGFAYVVTEQSGAVSVADSVEVCALPDSVWRKSTSFDMQIMAHPEM